jgi:hypothetical protein
MESITSDTKMASPTNSGGDAYDKIFLKDFDLEQNEHFIKFVFIPYFKDIYNDLADKSDKKQKGINKIVFTEVLYY